jgi:hypothetical protein
MSARHSERLLAKQTLQQECHERQLEAQRQQQECRERQLEAQRLRRNERQLEAQRLQQECQLEAQRLRQECRERQRLEAAEVPEPLAAATAQEDINLDALRYSNQINETCIFHTCAVCAVMDGLKQLHEFTVELKDSVSHVLLSGWAPFQQNFHVNVVASLEQPGYLIGAKYICKLCFQSLNAGDIPKRALINGYCTGTVPRVLEVLNRTEISMIAIVNPIIKLEMHSGGLKSRTDVISYSNNVAAIAQKLPRLPTAILRSKSRSVQHYRPQLVFAALNWLKINNRLYDAVTLDFPREWADTPVIIPEIVFDEENHDDADGNATNPSAVEPQDTFILDETSRSSISTMTDLVMERTDGFKVQRHTCDNYDGMAFPLLYPYGVGFPAGKDINFSYVNHRIRCGGPYKRFAENTDWLFTHYSYELRMKNGGIAAQAAKMQQYKDQLDGDDRILLINHLKSNITDAAKMARIRKILKLVQPYASVIPGSVLSMEQERNRLRSLVTSPVTTKEGHWRWFFTQAQSDLHSPLIYDNLVDNFDSIEDRHAKTDGLSKDQRRQLLLQNPVVAVRVWKLQQRAFFDCIINGCSKPLGGEVTDMVDKTEFQVKSTIHSHYMLCIRDPSLTERQVDIMSINTQQRIIDIVDATIHANSLEREVNVFI